MSVCGTNDFVLNGGGGGCFGPAPERDRESEKKSQSKPPRQEVVPSARTRGTYGVLAHLDGGLYHGPRGGHGLEATDLALPRRLPRGRPRRGPAANPERGVRRGGPRALARAPNPLAATAAMSFFVSPPSLSLRLRARLSAASAHFVDAYRLPRSIEIFPAAREQSKNGGGEGREGGGRQRYCN